MRQILRNIALSMMAGLVCAVAGCGGVSEIKIPDTGADLAGTVTYNNQKVMAALIVVQGPGGSATGDIGEDGSFNIKNVPLGDVNIAVNTDAGKGQLRGKMMARAQTKQKGDMPKLIDLPKKYFDPTSSGIKTTISKGPNKYDVVIKR